MADLAQQLGDVLSDRFPDDGRLLVVNPADWPSPPDGRDLQFQIGWWSALTMVAQTATSALTGNEHAMIAKVADLASDFMDVVGEGPTAAADWNEILPHLHALQQTILAQAAARTYPGKYRLLGDT